MSTRSLIVSVSHPRRIRDLEQLADTQRHLLDAQLDDMSHALKPWEVARSAFTHLAPVVPLIVRLFGSTRVGLGLGDLFGAFSGLGRTVVATEEKGRFPLRAALLVGTSALQVVRWLKRRRYCR